MRTIELTQGKVALVDDADYDRVNQFKWYANSLYTRADGTELWYAMRNVRRADGSQTTKLMHRYILRLTDTTQHIDHVDGNPLNNQRNNLRIVSRSVNMCNQYKHRAGRLVGTYIDKRGGSRPWAARVWVNGRLQHLGVFATEQEAHAAYLHARQNLPKISWDWLAGDEPPPYVVVPRKTGH